MRDLRELFGKTGRDLITGFEGVIVGGCDYISGCSQLLLSPKVDKEGKAQNGLWFDVQRVEVQPDVAQVVLPPELNAATPGCDIPAPIR